MTPSQIADRIIAVGVYGVVFALATSEAAPLVRALAWATLPVIVYLDVRHNRP